MCQWLELCNVHLTLDSSTGAKRSKPSFLMRSSLSSSLQHVPVNAPDLPASSGQALASADGTATHQLIALSCSLSSAARQCGADESDFDCLLAPVGRLQMVWGPSLKSERPGCRACWAEPHLFFLIISSLSRSLRTCSGSGSSTFFLQPPTFSQH